MIWLWCWRWGWWWTARVPQPIIDRATPFLLFCNRYRLFACSSASYSLLCNVICFTQLDDVNSIGWGADSSWISITLRRRWELVTTNVCQPTNRFLPRFDKGKAIDWVGEGSPKGRHRPNDHHKMPRKRKRRSDDLFRVFFNKAMLKQWRWWHVQLWRCGPACWGVVQVVTCVERWSCSTG